MSDSSHTDQAQRETFEQQLVSYVESVASLDADAEVYHSDGIIRDYEGESLTTEEERVVESLRQGVEPEAKQCYYNAQLATAEFTHGPDTPNLTYVEGYVITRQVPIPIQHAWVELNEKLVDLTLDAGDLRSDLEVYYGVEFSPTVVREILYDREQASPIARIATSTN